MQTLRNNLNRKINSTLNVIELKSSFSKIKKTFTDKLKKYC